MQIIGHWSTRIGFLLAATGASVGLGNIWKFPYIAGTNGGGAFVIIYVIAALIIAAPILISELLIGQMGQKSPPAAMTTIALKEGRSPKWGLFGWLGTISGFLIVSFYSVIAGWALAYFVKSLNGMAISTTAESSEKVFNQLLNDPALLTIGHTMFLLLTGIIVSRGISRGLEATAKLLMPALAIMLILVLIYAIMFGDFLQAATFLFAFDLEEIDSSTILIASGQAFFSIGVAMGLMTAYGSYLPKKTPLVRSALWITGMDTLFALLAGLAIFPLVFASQLDPASGPGLIFVTLPVAFSGMPYGNLFSSIFFLLLVFAALTSAVGLLEPLISKLSETGNIDRRKSSLIATFLAWFAGIGTVLSFNYLDSFFPIKVFARTSNMTIFELLDYTTSNIIMPVTAVGISIFCGYVLRKQALQQALELTNKWIFHSWYYSIRYIVPLIITVILFMEFF